MVLIKKEFQEMINEVENPEPSSSFKLRLVSVEPISIFAGIDSNSMQRILVIVAGKENWDQEQIKSLPKWKGMSLNFNFYAKIGPYENQYFLFIKQEEGYDTDVFEAVLQNIVEVLSAKKESDDLYPIVYRTLEKWKNFFSKGGFKKLNDEQQRGLFGELYYIKTWMSKNPGHPPTLIEGWEGPLSGRVDFIHSRRGIEIKTSIKKIGKRVKISNENQLLLTEAIDSIYLYICFMEKSRTHGISLHHMVQTVRELIEEISQGLLLSLMNYFLRQVSVRENMKTTYLWLTVLKCMTLMRTSHVSYQIRFIKPYPTLVIL